MESRIGSFIQHALLDLILNKVEVRLITSDRVLYDEADPDSIKCSGYFEEDPKKVFACAIGKPQKEWVPVFLHEYCHFLQFKDQTPIVKKYDRLKAGDFFDDWTTDEFKAPYDKAKKLIRVVRDLELDCEKRVVDLIDRFRLEIDRGEYIRTANAYVYFYNVVLHTKKWYDKKPPYQVEAIRKIMPDRFLKNYNRTPKKYTELVERYCL